METTVADDKETRQNIANVVSNTFGDEEMPSLEKIQFKVTGNVTCYL